MYCSLYYNNFKEKEILCKSSISTRWLLYKLNKSVYECMGKIVSQVFYLPRKTVTLR